MFGMGRPRALDRSAKARIMHMARCLSRGGSGYRDGNLAAASRRPRSGSLHEESCGVMPH